jgi:hypothetical protein
MGTIGPKNGNEDVLDMFHGDFAQLLVISSTSYRALLTWYVSCLALAKHFDFGLKGWLMHLLSRIDSAGTH